MANKKKLKQKSVAPICEEMSLGVNKFSCAVCGTVFKCTFAKINVHGIPNFCPNCGTQIKEIDENLLETWGGNK